MRSRMVGSRTNRQILGNVAPPKLMRYDVVSVPFRRKTFCAQVKKFGVETALATVRRLLHAYRNRYYADVKTRNMRQRTPRLTVGGVSACDVRCMRYCRLNLYNKPRNFDFSGFVWFPARSGRLRGRKWKIQMDLKLSEFFTLSFRFSEISDQGREIAGVARFWNMEMWGVMPPTARKRRKIWFSALFPQTRWISKNDVKVTSMRFAKLYPMVYSGAPHGVHSGAKWQKTWISRLAVLTHKCNFPKTLSSNFRKIFTVNRP